jgi:tetratricopeptide (TPR) repeat protein/TolB-like protein/tRNA A-37 threonylcarbamoyl transferase component Bud32
MQQPPSGETRSGAPELTGTVAGRFVIVKMLGAGGMGQVYQAQDTKLKRLVAIKRMAPELQQNDTDRRKFLREAQQASALNHPNIASIHDVIEEQGEIFLIMEYVEGTPLRAMMQAGSFATEEFFKVAAQGLEGLNAAHEKGILHGDIKPENIMLTKEGRVKVLDFGVARRFTLGNSNEATMTAATLSTNMSGTPAYMAPEVLMQRPYDGRADLFSMGLVCYEMLGGAQPFETDSIAGTLGAVLHTVPRPIEELNPRVSPSVSAVLQTMLAKDPERRYSTARDVLVDLRLVQEGKDPVFARSSPDLKLVKTGFSPTAKIATAVLVIVFVAAAFFFGARHRSPGPESRGAQGTAAQSTTLVVLPFDAVSDDAKLNAFGSGLVDTLTAKLAQLSGNHPVQVVSAGEIRQKSVTTLDQARQEFGANTGLHLGLQRTGDLVRVTYSLTGAKSGKIIKAGSSDAPVTDPFAIEDDVTKAVAAALGFSLKADEARDLAFHGTSIPDAYNYYTQARGYLEDASKAANVDSAVILLEQALKADPNYGRAQADLGSAYWAKYTASKDKSLIAKSRQACSKAIDLGNAGAAGHVCLGVIENGTGKYEEAVNQFQSAVQLEPSNEDAYIGLGGAYERLGKTQDAENTYKKIISLRANYWRGYNLLGAFYLRQAQYDDASKMFHKVVELTPESYRGYANLGATLIYEAKYADAIKPLEQSLAIHATAPTYSNLGTAYYYSHKFAEATSTYEKAVQLDDKDYLNWGNLGEASYLAGEHPKATEAYKKAIALAKQDLAVNPRDPQLLRTLANYYAMIDDGAESLKFLGKALEQSKSDKDSLFSASLIYNHLGDKGLALEWLGKALRAGYTPGMIMQQPDLDNLHGDARFEDLLRSTASGQSAAK